MFHYVYKTARPKTGEFYYGVHSCEVEFDLKYRGSGIKLLRKLRGVSDEFICGVICYFETRELAEEFEALLVDEELLKHPLCLNLQKGGGLPPMGSGKNNPFFGKTHTEETKSKMRRPKTEHAKRAMKQAKFKGWYYTPYGRFMSTHDAAVHDTVKAPGVLHRVKSPHFPDYYFVEGG